MGQPQVQELWWRLLGLVPMPLRSRWPLRRFFWQDEEIAAAEAQAAKWAKEWTREETTG